MTGEAIPIGARILSVVDCFDALTSDRPYRRRMTDAAAIEILLERRGRMYDPAVVDTFIRIYRDINVDAANTIEHHEVLQRISQSRHDTMTPQARPRDRGPRAQHQFGSGDPAAGKTGRRIGPKSKKSGRGPTFLAYNYAGVNTCRRRAQARPSRHTGSSCDPDEARR